MGVEPTAACSTQPAANFEDWGIHRNPTTPRFKIPFSARLVKFRAYRVLARSCQFPGQMVQFRQDELFECQLHRFG